MFNPKHTLGVSLFYIFQLVHDGPELTDRKNDDEKQLFTDIIGKRWEIMETRPCMVPTNEDHLFKKITPSPLCEQDPNEPNLELPLQRIVNQLLYRLLKKQPGSFTPVYSVEPLFPAVIDDNRTMWQWNPRGHKEIKVKPMTKSSGSNTIPWNSWTGF